MSLIVKYRPDEFSKVIGQDQVVRSIRGALKAKTSKAFLLIGIAGCGKTSIARLIAKHVKCDSRNIIEVDGATATGIDAMRSITDSMQYSALGSSPSKVYIIDECQRLSAPAFSSLLKSIEEPPPHVYWVLCTTDPQKIPKAIQTRCTVYTLNPVGTDDIHKLLIDVSASEGLDTSDDVLYLIAEKAGGSPRQALSGLALCAKCETRKEAAVLLRTLTEEGGEAVELCRLLIKGATWASAMRLVDKMGDVDAEGVRQTVLNYFSKAVQDAKSEDVAAKGLAVLQAFEKPYLSGNNRHCLLLSLGELLL